MLYRRLINLFLFALIIGFSQCALFATSTIDIPDSGWRLWVDRQAKWRTDDVYLPGDVNLKDLPVNPPTGGWGVLNPGSGIPVTLPSTVEQHYWGKFGSRPYKWEYFFEDKDSEVKNGAYEGVSWWWRTIAVPADFKGKVALLHVRGERQRAEVYVNRKLAGYNLMAETAFDCDVSQAIEPGKLNTIAIRITNPGGRFDWADWDTMHWGKLDIFKSHGFGGLDRGLTLSSHNPIYISDAWVLNTPAFHKAQAHAAIRNTSAAIANGTITVSVVDIASHAVLASAGKDIQISPNSEEQPAIDLACPAAKLWDTNHPNLYRMRFEWKSRAARDVRDVTFGFRWIAPDGIGKNAMLRLNGERLRVYSAISWGFWGLNGLWPTPELAAKEVDTAKVLGLNCLNFHRNIGKTEVLDIQDRKGLLRYMEPGGGSNVLGWGYREGETGEPINSMQKYELEKILRMIRDHRSHPSLFMYVLQNEMGDDAYKNPHAAYALRQMHKEDPSRIIVMKSGVPNKNELWMVPYDDTIYHDDGKGYSGWFDNHTVGYPEGVWKDNNYDNPGKYVYFNNNAAEIVDYGEMGGAAVPDDHALMLRQISQYGGRSYDSGDHRDQLNAYNAFLDKWKFREAFPSAESLFRSIGNKQYEYWRYVLECARLSDTTDYLTLSGWESTAIENHSGIVDNLRNPHGDPKIIQEGLRPILPALMIRKSAVNAGEDVLYDLYFLNDTNRPVKGTLGVTLTDPNGKVKRLGVYSVPQYKKDVDSYPVKFGLRTPKLLAEGVYKLTFALGKNSQTRMIYVLKPMKAIGKSVGVIGASGDLDRALRDIGIMPEPYRAGGRYDAIIAVSGSMGYTTILPRETPLEKTSDPDLYRVQHWGSKNSFEWNFHNLPNGKADVTLYFAETYWSAPKARIFDVDINGQTAIRDLDIFAESGGKNTALQKSVDVDITDGSLHVAPGHISIDNGTFAAIKISAGGKTFAYYFGDKPYTDKAGLVWRPYQAGLDSALVGAIKSGTPLMVYTGDDGVADMYAKQLSAAGAFKYRGLLGQQFASWMGSWYFVRRHPLYCGLPVNEAMHGDYQVGVNGANGLLVDGPGVEIVTGYGRDHSRNIGAGDFTAKLGKGAILFHSMPAMNNVFQARWMYNAIMYLGK